MWLTILSDQLPVLALVSRYLTNKLIGRGPIPERQAPKGPHLLKVLHAQDDNIRYYFRFRKAIPNSGASCPRVPHPFATLTRGTSSEESVPLDPVRLACLIHAASVRSEP